MRRHPIRLLTLLVVALALTIVSCTPTGVPEEPESTTTVVDQTTTSPASATTTSTVADDDLDLTGSLAYVTDTTGIERVWSVGLDGGEATVFSTTPVGALTELVVSPVGDRVASFDEQSHVIALDDNGDVVFRSSEEARLSPPSWSADGALLAFRADDDLVIADVVSGEESRPLPERAGLGIWAPRGDLIWAGGGLSRPSFMVDTGTWEVVTFEERGQDPTVAWSPVGDRIVLASASYDGTSTLSVAYPSGARPEVAVVEGAVLEIEVSPDGRLAAYTVVVSDDRRETHIADLDLPGDVANLDISGSLNWSDDGLGVAGTGESWLVSSDGRVLAHETFTPLDNGVDTVWDGSRFARYGRSGIVVGDAGGPAAMWSDLPVDGDTAPYFVDDGVVFVASLDGNRNEELHIADGSGARPLTDYPGDDYSPVALGGRVLFISDRGGERHIVIHDLATGEVSALPDTELPAHIMRLSPDRHRLAVLGVDGWTTALYEVDASTGVSTEILPVPETTFTLEGDETPPPNFGIAAMGAPDWSSEGDRVVVPTNGGGAVIGVPGGEFALAADAESLLDGYGQMLQDAGYEDIDFHNPIPSCFYTSSWSPNDEAIAFVYPCLSLYPVGLWMVDEPGADPVLLAGPVADVTGVSWSPDGEQVVFSHANIQTGLPEMSTVDARDGVVETLPWAGAWPVWSSDGSSLAFLVPGDDGGALVVRHDDDTLVTVAELPELRAGLWFAWSPDNRYLAYASPDLPGIFVVDASGAGEPVMISSERVVGLDWK